MKPKWKKKKKENLLPPPKKKKVMRTLWIEHRTSRLAVRLISLQSGALPTELSPLYMFCKEMCFYSTTMYISWWSCVGNKYMCFFFVFLFFVYGWKIGMASMAVKSLFELCWAYFGVWNWSEELFNSRQSHIEGLIFYLSHRRNLM